MLLDLSLRWGYSDRRDRGASPPKMVRRVMDGWADRYQHSDHHTDRTVQHKMDFEDFTGTDYPEGGRAASSVPEPVGHRKSGMARGKGGLASNVVLVTTRRRATSVPVEPASLTSYTPASYRRAQHVTNNCMDDSEALSTASKRQDRRLLDNINNRLFNASFTQPVQVRRGRRASVPSTVGRPQAAPRRPASVAPSGGCAKRIAMARRQRAVYDDDDEDVDLGSYSFPQFRLPQSRVQTRQYRAQSVPPRTNVDFGFIDTKSPLMRVADERASAYMSPSKRYVRTVEADYLRPYIPERPSYLATKVKGYRAASEPPKRRDNCLHAGQAVRRAREALGRVERETGVSGYDVDYDDYEEPLVTPTRIQPVRSAARTGFVRGSVPTAVRSHGRPPLPTPTSYSATPRSQRLAQIEARLNMQSGYDEPGYVSPVASYGQLRNQTHQARDKMDTHKVLLDRYLPINMGPENEVEHEVLYKYGELADRMPSLQPRQRRRSVDRASSVPPYRPSSAPVRAAGCGGGGGSGYANDSMRRPAFRPVMSDTRKRCREVLCRTKHDPRYFDY